MASLARLGFTRARVKRCFLISRLCGRHVAHELWLQWACLKRLHCGVFIERK